MLYDSLEKVVAVGMQTATSEYMDWVSGDEKESRFRGDTKKQILALLRRFYSLPKPKQF